MKTIFVGREDEILPFQSKKIVLKKGAINLEGFIINYKGKFFGYVNRCSHISLALDWGDNDFFSEDKKFLLCKNHGALYDPETGYCVAGPCAGDSLEQLSLKIEKGKLYCSLLQ
ncbi:MAG: Rieske 2Fe-2S domain-containing protein [Elusimicrobia bacterium]|nr:Rieske 2Fe-2S domain-containing protein [Elusimicrobiota bacterium]